MFANSRGKVGTASFSQAPVLTMPHQPSYVLPQPSFPAFPPSPIQSVQLHTQRASAAVPHEPRQQIPGPLPPVSVSLAPVSVPLAPVQSGVLPPVIGLDTSFKLKWLAGTSVSRCYGCNGVIKNPSESIPDDLIVVYRDIRQCRERITGQLRYTPTPQNVHFHLRAACIRARYPNFPGASALVVPDDFMQYFKIEHIQRLITEFGWAP